MKLPSVLFLVLGIFVGKLTAQSPFESLPFGFRIGTTKNSELEERGVCTKKIELTGGGFRCERFDMAGRFEIHSSSREILSKVVFRGYTGHSLPSSWVAAGLVLGNEGLGFDTIAHGSTAAEVDALLKKYGHSNQLNTPPKIQDVFSETPERLKEPPLPPGQKFWYGARSTFSVHYTVKNLNFEMVFSKLTWEPTPEKGKPRGALLEDQGLIEVNVTEQY